MTLSSECPNCQQALYGQFCSSCGQNQKGTDRYFLTLVNEAFEGLFSLNSKVWKTLFFLIFRPGFLTKEHFANRRARYISPLRLYLISSIGFFLLLSVLNFFSSDFSESIQISNEEQTSNVQEQQEGIRSVEAKDKTPNKIEMNFPMVSDEKEADWQKAMEHKIKNAVSILEERPKMFISKLIDSSPPVVLLLLPLFALVLKLFYLRSNRFYTQHLVLAVHNHSFLFLSLILLTAASKLLEGKIHDWSITIIWLWMVLYMVLSLKNTFEQRWAITSFKSIAIFSIYFVLFMFALVCVSLLGVISL